MFSSCDIYVGHLSVFVGDWSRGSLRLDSNHHRSATISFGRSQSWAPESESGISIYNTISLDILLAHYIPVVSVNPDTDKHLTTVI